MGSSSSKSKPKRKDLGIGINEVIKKQSQFQNVYVSPLAIQVAHYTPASFPLKPYVSKASIKICADSWEKVIAPVEQDGVTVSGLTLFYTQFYDTLEVFDKMGRFETVLKQHAGGTDSVAAKGAILVRIIHYVLAMDPDSEHCQVMLHTLGKSHNYKRIRPWQYSVFIQCLLNTISARLGAHATHDVMSAWVHLFAFVLRTILPIAIQGLVNETEVDINIATEADELAPIDKSLAARLNDGRQSARKGAPDTNGAKAGTPVKHAFE